MLKLNLPKEPYWLELPAQIKVKVKPLNSAIMNAAQASVIKQMRELKDTENYLKNEQERLGLSEALLVKSIGCFAIIEWENVFNATGNEVAELTHDNINELLDIWFIAQDFWKQYTTPLSALEFEGNYSPAALNGTSAVEQNIVPIVQEMDCSVVEEN